MSTRRRPAVSTGSEMHQEPQRTQYFLKSLSDDLHDSGAVDDCVRTLFSVSEQL